MPRFSAFTGYMVAYARREARVESYMVYMTESIRLLPRGASLKRTWYDIEHPRKGIDFDAEQTVEDVIDRLGLEVTENESA